MTDDFIRELRDDWLGQEVEFEIVRRRLRQDRWAPLALLGLDAVQAVAFLLFAGLFAWIAARTGHVAFTLSAVAMVIAAVLATAAAAARRDVLAWEEETPESVLRLGLRRADATLRGIRLGRWQLGAVAALVAAFWAAELTGLMRLREFLAFYTAYSGAVLAGAWIYFALRERRVRSERVACARLLADMRDADTLASGDASR